MFDCILYKLTLVKQNLLELAKQEPFIRILEFILQETSFLFQKIDMSYNRISSAQQTHIYSSIKVLVYSKCSSQASCQSLDSGKGLWGAC